MNQKTPNNDDAKTTEGQKFDEVTSEKSEILKKERAIDGKGDPEAEIYKWLILINKYIRAIYSCAIKRGANMETDKDVIRTNELFEQFLSIIPPVYTSMPDVFEGEMMGSITPNYDPANPSIVPAIAQATERVEMGKDGRLMLTMLLSKIGLQLSIMLASQIDIDEDLTKNVVKQEDFERRYFNE